MTNCRCHISPAVGSSPLSLLQEPGNHCWSLYPLSCRASDPGLRCIMAFFNRSASCSSCLFLHSQSVARTLHCTHSFAMLVSAVLRQALACTGLGICSCWSTLFVTCSEWSRCIKEPKAGLRQCRPVIIKSCCYAQVVDTVGLGPYNCRVLSAGVRLALLGFGKEAIRPTWRPVQSTMYYAIYALRS